MTRRDVDRVDHVVEPPGKPKKLSVCAHIPHVGASATGNGPNLFDLQAREIDDRHAAVAARRAVHLVGPAIRDIKFLAVPTGI